MYVEEYLENRHDGRDIDEGDGLGRIHGDRNYEGHLDVRDVKPTQEDVCAVEYHQVEQILQLSTPLKANLVVKEILPRLHLNELDIVDNVRQALDSLVLDLEESSNYFNPVSDENSGADNADDEHGEYDEGNVSGVVVDQVDACEECYQVRDEHYQVHQVAYLLRIALNQVDYRADRVLRLVQQIEFENLVIHKSVDLHV